MMYAQARRRPGSGRAARGGGARGGGGRGGTKAGEEVDFAEGVWRAGQVGPSPLLPPSHPVSLSIQSIDGIYV